MITQATLLTLLLRPKCNLCPLDRAETVGAGSATNLMCLVAFSAEVSVTICTIDQQHWLTMAKRLGNITITHVNRSVTPSNDQGPSSSGLDYQHQSGMSPGHTENYQFICRTGTD